MICDHGMMLMGEFDDAYVDAMIMVNIQANTRSVTRWTACHNAFSQVVS